MQKIIVAIFFGRSLLRRFSEVEEKSSIFTIGLNEEEFDLYGLPGTLVLVSQKESIFFST